MLGLVLERVRSSRAEELTIEERSWSAAEIAEEIQILSEAARLDWREELALAVQSLEETENEHARQIDEARFAMPSPQ